MSYHSTWPLLGSQRVGDDDFGDDYDDGFPTLGSKELSPFSELESHMYLYQFTCYMAV